MPWRETCAMDQRLQFISEWQCGEYTMSDLCRMFGISRTSGYETVARFQAEGYAGLQERSRAPLHHPHAVAQNVRELLVALRKKHGWGPVKLLHWMQNHQPRLKRPAPSTVDELLRREGLIEPRRRVRRATPYGAPYTIAVAPNDLWCADFQSHAKVT
jgi:putative transposase